MDIVEEQVMNIVERLRDIEGEWADAEIREEAATEIERLRARLNEWENSAVSPPLAAAVVEIERLRTDFVAERKRVAKALECELARAYGVNIRAGGQVMAGWEVEGFIDRLTRRDDTNSERLILEAISHLRAFSRDCDALREAKAEAVAAERERSAGELLRRFMLIYSTLVDQLRAEIVAERERNAEIARLEGARAAAMDDPCAAALEHQAQRVEAAIRKGE